MNPYDLTAKCGWQDGTFHVELPELPKEIMVRLPDKRGNHVRSARVWTYVPERTCQLVDNDSGPEMHCTACNGEVDDEYRYFMERWGYSRCPHCGARIEEE